MASLLSACGGGGGGGGPTYTIGGTLSGLTDGQTIDLSQGSETLTLRANGTFTFDTPIRQGRSYEVKFSSVPTAWLTCDISNATGSAVSANVSNVEVKCTNEEMTPTGLLNDTGIDVCAEDITTGGVWVSNAVCKAVNWLGKEWGLQQDAFFGRDAQAKAGTLTKVGGGQAGFDFTKIGNRGNVLLKQDGIWREGYGTEAAGTKWDCVRDNVTGLVWEVKNDDPNHLRYRWHGYAWYNPDDKNNGGSPGVETPELGLNGSSLTQQPTCTGLTKCNTQSYVDAVNTVGLCGKADWRMPTADELRNLVHWGDSARNDVYYFWTSQVYMWTSSPYPLSNDRAFVAGYDGYQGTGFGKNTALGVRLVRSGR
jgi:hypothetical protein